MPTGSSKGAATVFVSGNFVPPDPDGFVITFAAAGKDAKGPATASSLPIIGTADGTISGGINGAMLDLTCDNGASTTQDINF